MISNYKSSSQNQGLFTKWWYFAAVVLAASSDHPRIYAHGCKLIFQNDKNQFKVCWLKWNLRPSTYPCSAKFLRNLLSTNSSFRPKWKGWNNDLNSMEGGIDYMSIGESNSNFETSGTVSLKCHFNQLTLNWFLAFWNISMQPWALGREWSEEASKTTATKYHHFNE